MATNWTSNQQLAIDTIGQNMQIVACAGSGKTSTMVAHILRLIEEDDVNPENIAAITYTEKAAASLKQKVYDEYKKTHDTIEGLANMYIGIMVPVSRPRSKKHREHVSPILTPSHPRRELLNRPAAFCQGRRTGMLLLQSMTNKPAPASDDPGRREDGWNCRFRCTPRCFGAVPWGCGIR